MNKVVANLLSDDLAIRPAGNVANMRWEIFTCFVDNGDIIKNQQASSLVINEHELDLIAEQSTLFNRMEKENHQLREALEDAKRVIEELADHFHDMHPITQEAREQGIKDYVGETRFLEELDQALAATDPTE